MKKSLRKWLRQNETLIVDELKKFSDNVCDILLASPPEWTHPIRIYDSVVLQHRAYWIVIKILLKSILLIDWKLFFDREGKTF